MLEYNFLKKDLNTLMAVFSIRPMRRKDVRRRALIEEVNNWLQNLCQRQGFHFYGHGTLFENQYLLGKDKIHLSKGQRHFC